MKHIILSFCITVTIIQTLTPMNPPKKVSSGTEIIEKKASSAEKKHSTVSEQSSTTNEADSTTPPQQIPQQAQARLHKQDKTPTNASQSLTQEEAVRLDQIYAKKYPISLQEELLIAKCDGQQTGLPQGAIKTQSLENLAAAQKANTHFGIGFIGVSGTPLKSPNLFDETRKTQLQKISHQQELPSILSLLHAKASQENRKYYENVQELYAKFSANRPQKILTAVDSGKEYLKTQSRNATLSLLQDTKHSLQSYQKKRAEQKKIVDALRQEDEKINQKYRKQKLEAQQSGAVYIPQEQYELWANILKQQAILEDIEDQITILEHAADQTQNHLNMHNQADTHREYEKLDQRDAIELHAFLSNYQGQLEKLNLQEKQFQEAQQFHLKSITREHEGHLRHHLDSLKNIEYTLATIQNNKAILSDVIRYGENRAQKIDQEALHKANAEQLETQHTVLISKDYILSPETAALIKEYDSNLLQNHSITATAEQHILYEQNFNLLDKINILKSINSPEIKKIYLDGVQLFSVAALEQVQGNNIEIAATYTEVAAHMLYNLCVGLKDAAVTDLLIAKGITIGSIRGVVSAVKGAINTVLHPIDTGQALGKVLIHMIDTLADRGPLGPALDIYEKNMQGKPIDEQAAFLTEIIVSFVASGKCSSAINKALGSLSVTIEAELSNLKTLLKTGEKVELATHAPTIVSTLQELEAEVGASKEYLANFLEKHPQSNAKLGFRSAGKREIVLPKVATYEHARNKALEIIGEVDVHSGKPMIGKMGVCQGKVAGRKWHGEKVTLRLDYDPVKGPHINATDYRDGKSLSLALPFEGTEETVKSLLNHLQ